MTGHPKQVSEPARLEDHLVYALLALPIFAVTVLIVVLIATLGTK